MFFISIIQGTVWEVLNWNVATYSSHLYTQPIFNSILTLEQFYVVVHTRGSVETKFPYFETEKFHLMRSGFCIPRVKSDHIRIFPSIYIYEKLNVADRILCCLVAGRKIPLIFNWNYSTLPDFSVFMFQGQVEAEILQSVVNYDAHWSWRSKVDRPFI